MVQKVGGKERERLVLSFKSLAGNQGKGGEKDGKGESVITEARKISSEECGADDENDELEEEEEETQNGRRKTKLVYI